MKKETDPFTHLIKTVAREVLKEQVKKKPVRVFDTKCSKCGNKMVIIRDPIKQSGYRKGYHCEHCCPYCQEAKKDSCATKAAGRNPQGISAEEKLKITKITKITLDKARFSW